MRYQSKRFTCGPASICNALSVYGIYIPEEEACKIDPKGTTERTLMAGIRENGKTPVPSRSRSQSAALDWLGTTLALGSPAILCTDDWSHWVTCVGKLGSRYIIADSAHPELMLFLSTEELLARWVYSEERYYAVAVV